MSKPQRVLIVDDSKPIRSYLRQVLKALPVDVVGEAGNGAEAVIAFKTLQPDVVLLDINMPIMDGRAALKEIRKQDTAAHVIMLTSVNWSESVTECLEAGAANYLLKDLPKDELVLELQAALDTSESGEP